MFRYKILFLSLLIFVFAGCYRSAGREDLQIVKEAPAVAIVNRRPVERERLLEVMFADHGAKTLEEIVLLEVVRQDAGQKGIIVSKEDISGEFDRILEQMSPGKSRREQLALFEYMLESRKLGRWQFDLIVERQAILRRLVDPNVVVIEQMIAEEYERQHGRKVLVRQLVTGGFRSIQEAKKRLEAGEDFTAVIELYSQDQVTLERGGLLGPFSKTDEEIPEQVRKEAFGLDEVGRESDIFRFYDEKNIEWWAILQLERDFPADNASITELREELIQTVKQRTIGVRMMELQRELRSQAEVIVLEPRLR